MSHNKIRITQSQIKTTQTFTIIIANQKECEKIYMSLVLITRHLVLQNNFNSMLKKKQKNNVSANYAPWDIDFPA